MWGTLSLCFSRAVRPVAPTGERSCMSVRVGSGQGVSSGARSLGTWARVYPGRGVGSPGDYTARLLPGTRWLLYVECALPWYHLASPPSLPSLATVLPKPIWFFLCPPSSTHSQHRRPSGGPSWPHDYPLSPFIHVRVTVPYFLCCAFQNLQLFSWFTCDHLTTTWEPREGGTM